VEHITPGRLVSLIHAVPKPLAAKGARAIGFQELACVQREPAETLASIAGTLLIDAPSTGKIDIKAEWTDTVDDASLSAWARVARTAQPFQNVSTSTRDEDSLVPIAGSHKFDDTKHHVVQYRAAAATRFVDCYEGAKTDVSGTYVTISEPRDVHIPSTARPALPDVLYVVPTFIGEEKSSGRSKEVMRRCGMRIYLRRGWFSSGEGERLAIVFPASGTIDPLLEPLLTEWGSDPTWQSEPVRRRPNESDFPGGVPADAIAVVKRESSSADTAAEAKFPVRILTYPVAVDAEKSLLYADIDIVPPDGAYMPFVRLALARYQEHSVKDLHLSPLVRAAFVQVTPERRLTVTNRGHGEYEVTLQGTSPLVPPHTNEFPLQATSVEVTLERKVDGLSESHANWFPVPAFAPVELTRDNDGWRRRLLVGSFWRDAHRFVIREYEHYLADATADGATAREVKRLVYAYPLRLEDI
jgi:hypothetical protein